MEIYKEGIRNIGIRVSEELRKDEDRIAPPFYYYQETTTICLLINEMEFGYQIVARGIAICSPRDQFSRKVGRAKALGMALRAITHRRSSGDIKPQRFQDPHPIFKVGFRGFEWRSEYRPRINSHETDLINSTRKKKEDIMVEDKGSEIAKKAKEIITKVDEAYASITTIAKSVTELLSEIEKFKGKYDGKD